MNEKVTITEGKAIIDQFTLFLSTINYFCGIFLNIVVRSEKNSQLLISFRTEYSKRQTFIVVYCLGYSYIESLARLFMQANT